MPLDVAQLKSLINTACEGLGSDIKPEPIVAETMRNLYDGVPIDEVYKASILAARTLIEKDPDYTYATARLLLHTIFKEILGRDLSPAEAAEIAAGRSDDLAVKPATRKDVLQSRSFWAIAVPRFLSEPAWQTFNFFIPLYLVAVWKLDLKSIAMWAWLPFLAADFGSRVENRLQRPILLQPLCSGFRANAWNARQVV